MAHKLSLFIRLGSLTFAAFSLLAAVAAQAETLDFGGDNEKYKGAGDHIPPKCQVSYPTASQEPFFIKWNCEDDIADPLDIKTEFWIYRSGAAAAGFSVGQLLTSFLGFPASVKIDESLLRVTNFVDGLPISFRLIASDRAGNSTMTPLITIRSQDNSLAKCDLTVTAAASESSGDTTGLPEERVTLTGVPVSVTQTSSSNFRVSASEKTGAATCQIESICKESQRVSFSADLSISSAGEVDGSATVLPSSFSTEVEGSGTLSGSTLQSVEVTGTGTLDGRDTSVEVNCSRN